MIRSKTSPTPPANVARCPEKFRAFYRPTLAHKMLFLFIYLFYYENQPDPASERCYLYPRREHMWMFSAGSKHWDNAGCHGSCPLSSVHMDPTWQFIFLHFWNVPKKILSVFKIWYEPIRLSYKSYFFLLTNNIFLL